ncbi:Alpha/Beta hydrolase protein [Ochromonadaceae sp. CCMP2298]|nr:Alpha/Beta hydrolase protein [Ochromonadaceae sp. CCMP2298]
MLTMVPMLLLLFCATSVVSFSLQNGPRRSFGILSMQNVVLFNPTNLRVHDNPCLQQAERSGEVTKMVFICDPEVPVDDGAVRSLQRGIKRLGGELEILHGPLRQQLDLLLASTPAATLVAARCRLDPYQSLYDELYAHLRAGGVETVILQDRIADPEGLNFKQNERRYELGRILKPQMSYRLTFEGSPEHAGAAGTAGTEGTAMRAVGAEAVAGELEGEELGLQLLRDYVRLGEGGFSSRYEAQYVAEAARSQEHRLSLERLGRGAGGKSSALFQGEVLSGLLAPLLSSGSLSPRLVAHARRILFTAREAFALSRPLVCRLRNEAVRHDWHRYIASKGVSASSASASASASSTSSSDAQWDIKFTTWRGYVQREARMDAAPSSSSTSTSSSTTFTSSSSLRKPILLLLHGFGGSIDQFTGLARALAQTPFFGGFEIHALDSLGFGQSEKPPLSYNQYLWRDQVVEYVRRVAGEGEGGPVSVVVMGNSIGGFTAASVAAALSQEQEVGQEVGRGQAVQCAGLVLMNSAGVVINGTDAGASAPPAIGPVFTPYSGPAPELLRLFGRGVFAALQPRITQTCEWLYPSNPAIVASGLGANIYRDSCDPGASDVIAAGGKLPKPIPMNELFDQYLGPVLIAQGALDPLNDAVARAYAFEQIRGDVAIRLLELGHCPMDENAGMVASSIEGWAREKKIAVVDVGVDVDVRVEVGVGA